MNYTDFYFEKRPKTGLSSVDCCMIFRVIICLPKSYLQTKSGSQPVGSKNADVNFIGFVLQSQYNRMSVTGGKGGQRVGTI